MRKRLLMTMWMALAAPGLAGLGLTAACDSNDAGTEEPTDGGSSSDDGGVAGDGDAAGDGDGDGDAAGDGDGDGDAAGDGDGDVVGDGDGDGDLIGDGDGDGDMVGDGDGDGDGDYPGDIDGDGFGQCVGGCLVAADCLPATGAGADQGEDNYSCDDGVCMWTGCNDDSECPDYTQQGGPHFVCSAAGFGPPQCVPPCTTASDCVPPPGPMGEMAPAYADVDNYSCETGGECLYLGCISDDECEDGYGCHDPGTGAPPSCTPACTDDIECAFDGLPFDSWVSCVDGLCQFDGCGAPSECLVEWTGGEWVCDPDWQGNANAPDQTDCDCGCGAVDPDCVGAGYEACDFENCPIGYKVDPSSPASCIIDDERPPACL